MGYTNETTHYGIPLPLGSDKTTPMDYNTAMQAVDTALYGAVTDASAGVTKANAVEEALGTTNDNLSALTGRVTSAEGTITTQGNAITQLQLDVADVKADTLDMICAVDEGTAQVASVAVQEGKYFRYNNVLYIATADIAIGDTIVPNTNCRATNVATELESVQGSETITAQNVGYDNTSSGLTADDVQEAIDELNTDLSAKQDTLTVETLNPTVSKGSCVAKRYGKVVNVQLRGVITANADETLVSGLPIPQAIISASIYFIDTMNKTAFYLDNSGMLKPSSAISSHNTFLSFTYICN